MVLARIKTWMRLEWALLAVLLLAFIVRVVGVGYGLPLTVVADETHFTFAALKMLQLQTVVPALHPEAFQTILPYPPYLSYLLLFPFAAVLGLKYLFWEGSTTLFEAHLVSDLSPFFLTARLVSVILGTLSVFFVYRIAETLFRSRIAALASGLLLATSILHVALSMVGRNWLPVSFAFVLIFYVLTRDWSIKSRYLFAFIVAGLGMGVSSLSALFCIFIGLYYLLFDARSLRGMLTEVPRLSIGGLLFVALAFIPSLLHQGNAFVGSITFFGPKSLAEFFISPWSAFSLIAYSEPVLLGAASVGLVFLFAERRRLATLVTAWTLLYIAIFYTVFRFDARFLLPLVPVCALLAGYAVARVWNRTSAALILLVLLVPIGGAMRLSSLALQGDTREAAREWILEHLTPDDKILVFSSAMHVPTQKEAVAELRAIDPGAIRTINESDEVLDREDVPYALNNLTSVSDRAFARDLAEYARRQRYSYFLVEPRSMVEYPEMREAFSGMIESADLVAEFSGFGDYTSIYSSAFTESLATLFEQKSLGPDIFIYQFR